MTLLVSVSVHIEHTSRLWAARQTASQESSRSSVVNIKWSQQLWW